MRGMPAIAVPISTLLRLWVVNHQKSLRLVSLKNRRIRRKTAGKADIRFHYGCFVEVCPLRRQREYTLSYIPLFLEAELAIA